MDLKYFLQRNKAIDMFRALTMAVMVFVNDMGRIAGVPKWLEHGDWGEDFMGLADFVFPCFLVAVGMSIPYAIESRYSKGKSAESTLWHILSRTFALIVMGVFLVNSEGGIGEAAPFTSLVYRPSCILAFFLVWNVYPRSWSGKWFKTALQCVGMVVLLWFAFNFVDRQGNAFAARWWGILGLIAWSYLFCAIAYMLVRKSRMGAYCVWGALFAIAVLLSPVKESLGGRSIIAFENNFLYTLLHDTLHIDNGVHHLLVMSGVCITLISARLSHMAAGARLWRMLLLVVVLIVMSVLCNIVWIFNKLTPTLPWALMAIAGSLGVYALYSHFSHTRVASILYTIIRPAGTATLTVYMVPSLMYCLFEATGFTLPHWVVCSTWGLIYTALFSLVCVHIGGMMERCKIKLKV